MMVKIKAICKNCRVFFTELEVGDAYEGMTAEIIGHKCDPEVEVKYTDDGEFLHACMEAIRLNKPLVRKTPDQVMVTEEMMKGLIGKTIEKVRETGLGIHFHFTDGSTCLVREGGDVVLISWRKYEPVDDEHELPKDVFEDVDLGDGHVVGINNA